MPWNSLGRLGVGAASALSAWLGSTAVQALEPLDRIAVGSQLCPSSHGTGAANVAELSAEGVDCARLAAVFRCSGH